MDRNQLTIALVGNPNTGKTTVFNALTGLKQKIGNYPGVTVERKTGVLQLDGVRHTVIDLPGTYSLNPKSIDERIAYETLIGKYEYEATPNLAIVIVDASNLERNLYLVTQVMDLGIPMIVALNMMDVAEERGINADPQLIQNLLRVPVVPMAAKREKEIKKLREAISRHDLTPAKPLLWSPSDGLQQSITLIKDEWLKPYTRLPENSWNVEALRLLSNTHILDELKDDPEFESAKKVVEKARKQMEGSGENWMAAEVMGRYNFIAGYRGEQDESSGSKPTLTDRIDAIVTHKILGPIVFILILLVMFESIFTWATPFMDLIDLGFIKLGTVVSHLLPAGILNDLIVQGVIAGLGGVIVFLPQIMFLFFFISVLEGTGYMARAAFVMDGFMSRIGLHGRSVVPLISGFACAVPGIMAARTIESWRDRLITIMVLPFMSCSARLPVYALMISAFIPRTFIWGFISLQGLVFFGLYLFGIITAIIAAFVMKHLFSNTRPTPFIMELPSYKMPRWSSVFRNMVDRGWIFVTEAGKVIVAISIILWFLASFPKVHKPGENTSGTKMEHTSQVLSRHQQKKDSFDPSESQAAYQLTHSYAGMFGHFMEPAIKPLGFDWKLGIGLISSFAAREVMVGTLNTIYSIQDENGSIATLKQKMIADRDPRTGKSVYSTLTAISLMIFFALACQCMSTLATVRRETNSWKWPVVMFLYMTSLAYLVSLFVYQGGLMLGLG